MIIGDAGREVSTNSVMGTTATGRRRHRSWPEALKREIVAATLVPGSSVSIMARQYDVNANQVFAWRKRYAKTGSTPDRGCSTAAGDDHTGPGERADGRQLWGSRSSCRQLSGSDRQRRRGKLRLVLDVLERR